MKLVCPLSFILVVAAGCSTTPIPTGAEKPVRYASSVQVASYDSDTRTSTTRLEVFPSVEAVGQRSYRIIALLARGGNREDEGLIMNANAWRARQLGAEGMIIIDKDASPLVNMNTSVRIGGWPGSDKSSKEKPVFRAYAIVFTSLKPPRHDP